jgi:hypothetical protein
MKTIISLILALSLTNSARPQEMDVPIEQQLPLLLKILCFDRALKERVGDEIVFAVIYQKKYKKSLNVKEGLESNINKLVANKIDNIPISFMVIDMSDEIDLSSIIDNNHVDVIYVTPVKALNIESVTSVSRQKHIMTLTGISEYVESGIAVGIGAKGGKPQIMINLPSAKAEGIDFSSQLLKMAKIID